MSSSTVCSWRPTRAPSVSSACRWLGLAFLLIGLSANACQAEDPFAYRFNLSVASHKYVDMQINPASILSDASDILRARDGVCYDEPCCIWLAQKGSTGQFEVRADLDVVVGEADMNLVFDVTSYDIKVVDEIYFLLQDGSRVAVAGVAVSTTRNAILRATALPTSWAHEFGHMKGINDDDGCSALVMNGEANSDNVAVTIGQCLDFLKLYVVN